MNYRLCKYVNTYVKLGLVYSLIIKLNTHWNLEQYKHDHCLPVLIKRFLFDRLDQTNLREPALLRDLLSLSPHSRRAAHCRPYLCRTLLTKTISRSDVLLPRFSLDFRRTGCVIDVHQVKDGRAHLPEAAEYRGRGWKGFSLLPAGMLLHNYRCNNWHTDWPFVGSGACYWIW